VLYFNSQKSAIQNNPYDVAYLEQYEYNNIPSSKISNIIKEAQTPLNETKELNYIEQSSFMIFSQDEINKLYQCNFDVKPGYFINIYQFQQDDGYKHEMFDIGNLQIDYQLIYLYKEIALRLFLILMSLFLMIR